MLPIATLTNFPTPSILPIYRHSVVFKVFLDLISQILNICKNLIESKNYKIKILENLEASYCMVPLTVKNIVAAFRGIHMSPAKHSYA